MATSIEVIVLMLAGISFPNLTRGDGRLGFRRREVGP